MRLFINSCTLNDPQFYGEQTAMSDTETFPLHQAAGKGDIPEIRRLLNAGIDIESRTADGSTPLHYAAYYAQPDAASALIALDADINAQSTDGTTPLHDAVWSRHSPTIQVFLDAGAKADIRDSEGRRPVDIADAEGMEKDEQYHRLVELSRH